MSDRTMWKMLHLLYTLKPGQNGLSDQALLDVGIDCGPDTVNPLLEARAVAYDGRLYALTEPARKILGTCIVANRRWSSDDMWVDYPSAFVIMPFSQPWSETVYRDLIKPGVNGAGLKCVRGDTVVRIGDLTQNIWGALLRAGIVVADVSALNANVFYELGLAHALGKDAIILKQAGSNVPADIGGAHYHEYDLQTLDRGRSWLSAELSEWAKDNHCQAVRTLRDV
ncbi:MAG: hypothetical protein WAU45_03600 [Blastocatellia bacterium]